MADIKCPVCLDVLLSDQLLDEQLSAKRCARCGGSWLHAQDYWDWLERQKNGSASSAPVEPTSVVPAPVVIADATLARRCPECGHFLTHAKVGHGVLFHLDRCGTCGGLWFNAGEWPALRERQLHTQVHFVFSAAWQARIVREELMVAREAIVREKIGAADLDEIKRVKQWLDAHPHRAELYAYLMPEADRH
jgi:Zn-finger nucleic acid-binding protein